MHYTLWRSGKDSKWYFKLVARNHRTIAMSQGYESKQAAKKGIRSVRINAPLSRIREID